MLSGVWRLIDKDPDRVYLTGVDMGGFGKVLARNDKFIVVKWPSGKHWTGVGMQPAYHSPQTSVFEIVAKRKDGDGLSVKWAIEWENTRKKK